MRAERGEPRRRVGEVRLSGSGHARPVVARVLRRAGEWALVALVTAAVAECGLRLYDAVRPSFLFRDRGYNQYRLGPGSPGFDIRANSQGFLDTEFTLVKPPGTFRIVALGDSFAVGVVPYRANFLTLLDEKLNARYGHVEVYNMGIAATGPDAYLQLLQDEGLSYHPDLVLVSFFVGNDFTDRIEDLPGRPALYLARVFKLLEVVLWDLRHTSRFLEPYDDDWPGMQDEAFLRIERERSEIYWSRSPRVPALFARAARDLEAMGRVCGGRGVALAVVIIPDELQVTEGLQRAVVDGYWVAQRGVPAAEIDLGLPNGFLHRELDRIHVPWVDLAPQFAAATPHGRLYRSNNTHWNVPGNALAADVIFEFLAREGLVRR